MCLQSKIPDMIVFDRSKDSTFTTEERDDVISRSQHENASSSREISMGDTVSVRGVLEASRRFLQNEIDMEMPTREMNQLSINDTGSNSCLSVDAYRCQIVGNGKNHYVRVPGPQQKQQLTNNDSITGNLLFPLDSRSWNGRAMQGLLVLNLFDATKSRSTVVDDDGIAAPLQSIGNKLHNSFVQIPGIELEYTAYLQDTGYTRWVSSEPRLEGFAIRIKGDKHKTKWSIRYRSQLSDSIDTTFVRDGQFCGIQGESGRSQAILVSIVPRRVEMSRATRTVSRILQTI
jgi:hypothetical protein